MTRVMERVKKEIGKRLEHLTELTLNDQNCRVLPVAGYVMNVCHLGKEELDKIVRNGLRNNGSHEDSQVMKGCTQRETTVEGG